MDDLPIEMLCEILRYVSPDECMPVCSLWREITREKSTRQMDEGRDDGFWTPNLNSYNIL